ncbi:LOW QUALITY PROTEIN: cadherin-23 [Culicoides brevitarsis]|uniref:LOW QUALITY PROTEIN: cadherin-23 n=1 Tax=Culicoides brevitarsis TaxID=469753 RepID=UPI00307B73BA
MILSHYTQLFKVHKYHKKVRLKRMPFPPPIVVLIYCLTFLLSSVQANRPPRFQLDGNPSEIVVRLKEGKESPIGTLIYRLKALDPDGDHLTFGIKNDIDSDVIRIETIGENDANIRLNKELDRETKDEYHFVLTLTDNRLGDGRFVTQSLLLIVDDINDNTPIFKPFQSALEVPENSPPGIVTTVEATDLDSGAFGQVVYYLQELEGDNDVFTISPSQGKGVIRLTQQLDYERKSLYQLRVLAVDRSNQGPVNTGTAALLIRVKDVEDQPPEFIVATPVQRVSEGLPKNTKITSVKAIDGDRGINNKIKYSIIRGGDGLFTINENTGDIYNTRELDREDPRNQLNGAFILEILATERSKLNPPPSVRTEVTIILNDINDETPTFRDDFYNCEIHENAQENTPLTFIGETNNAVFDLDQGNNGTFELFLEPPNDVFDISPKRAINEANFLIRVRNPKMLDYEKVKLLNFSIVAKEIVKNGKSSKVPVTIRIRDRNDNFPEFARHVYEVSVPENADIGWKIAEIEAFDADSGDFGTQGIRYTNLTGSIAHLLHLDPITGIISIQFSDDAFDRELYAKHYLTVEARDNLGTGNRNTVQLIINLEDENDNAPRFLQGKYEARLLENKLQFENPLIIEARDADVADTPNSNITYVILDGEHRSNFTIDPVSGKITPRTPIDFERLTGGNVNIRPIYLTVLARDNGDPSLASKVPVVIYVHDVNDHAPEFQNLFYEEAVPEDIEPSISILEVRATDRDGSSPNNAIFYRIQSGAKDKFVIGADTGVISVAIGASLDPDLTQPKTLHYSLVVLALDGGIGDQQLQTSCLVNITIKDVNNKSPVFVDPETVIIRENTPVGTYAYRLMANDLDMKPKLRYFIDGNHSEARTEDGVVVKTTEYDYLSAFELNPVDGLIRIVKLLDRERVETIKLSVLVEDQAAEKGRQVSSSILNIIIDDENDNNPRFQQPFYKKSITENSPTGIQIANVLATDIDKNKTIKYSLEGPPEITELVNLNAETGEIVVRNKIDHELHKWLNFTVRATDNGIPARSSMVEVFVQVIDENDNNPYFIGDIGNFTVFENAPVGTRIAMLQAGDPDAGEYGKITFLMDRISSQGKFSIDADTGVLVVADTLDRETRDSYMVVIEAWDNYQFGYLSGESRNAFKQIFITILDVNDNPPRIHAPKECVQVTEFHKIRDPITSIRATDADNPKLGNGQVHFELFDDENSHDLFALDQIDAWNAQIFAKRPLNGFYGNYSLSLIAKDLGSPQNVVKERLDICILDFNDHAPVFVAPSNNFTIRIPENATLGTQLIQVRAVDEDVGPNAAVKYRLRHDAMGNYRTFSIDELSGVISLKMPLDRERQKVYEIRVEAYDQGIPTPLSTDLDLTVYVRNVNDYEPQFLVEELTVNFTEATKPGMERKKLPDTVDRDEVDDLDDPPSTVCYFIVYGNERNLFHLDPESHILTTLKELDRETKANHTLIIKATENCADPPPKLQIPTTEALSNDTIDHEKIILNRNQGTLKYLDHIDRFKMSKTVSHGSPDYFIQSSEAPYFESYTGGMLVIEDSTLVRVIVHVKDVNDNPPQFVSKVFTGGVTTSTSFGAEFMKITATDRDEGRNARITYYQVGEIQKTLAEGLDNVKTAPFIVDRHTGAISLNFYPQKGMKGYFDFMVLANDTDGFQDVAHVFIYLLREDQRVRFVLRQHPAEVQDEIYKFRDKLSNVTQAIVNIDDFKIHANKDGTFDKTKTDLFLHLVDRRDNSILEVSDVLRLIDQNIEMLDGLFKEFNVLDTQAAEALPLIGEARPDPMLVYLVVSNLFIGALLIVILVLCATQRTTYKRQLRAAKVNAFVPPTANLSTVAPRVPNTNKHSVEGSNPMWLRNYSYENEWYKNDEDYDLSMGPGPAFDSIDENVIAAEEYLTKTNELNAQNSNMTRYSNVYQQIDKLSSGTMLTKKLETTEL